LPDFPGVVGILTGVVGVLGTAEDFADFVAGFVVAEFLVVVIGVGLVDVVAGMGFAVPLVGDDGLGFPSTVVDAIPPVVAALPR
jgi:hypothetical protein